MDAQGPGGAGEFDPADQWVFDPNTGNYELRLNPAETSADDTTELRRVPRSSSGDGAAGSEPRGRRRAAKREEKEEATGPVSRRKPKPKKSKAKKALYWGSGTLAFLLVGGSAAAYFVYQHLNSNISKVDVGENNAAVSDGPMNILLIGTDRRDGKGNEGYGDAGSVGHADTTLLFHVSEDRSNATVLSIPRDMITDIPDCRTKQENGSFKNIPGESEVRFNTSLGQEGRDPGCTWQTVEKLTGLEIDHFMMADFNAVKEMSSAVGGVEVCLAKDVNDPKSHLNLKKGRHTIEGEEALAFVRTRHTVGFGGDLDRIKLQQQFLSSLMRKMKSSGTLSSPGKLWGLAQTATKALTVDTGIGTVSKLASLGKNLSKVDLKNVTFATVPVVDNTDGATVLLDKTKAEPLFAMVRQDVSLTEVKEKEKAAKDKQAALLKGPKADPADVRVKVLNGSGQFGAAQETVDWMQNTEGMLRTSNGGNAPSELKKTTLEYAPNQADQARRLADSMGLPASAMKQGTKDAEPMAEMTLTLGADFKGAGTPISAPSKAPKDIQRVGADDKNVCAK
ncbi:LytR family transcriptional regulator [Streptomyces sp. SID8382]|uniref:LCP family protein n=1 Tax=Streptomyces malaysiensis TaxID=92644 RepID=UPI000C2CD350|nr:LCP family protein [Streptomyces sp. M56]AUA13345.1 Putative transcriptional regulator YwtF [Streptomyces sp. M56]MYX56320.1 LytR family transcriptional regulator [Streptomyces sp. SID8382]